MTPDELDPGLLRQRLADLEPQAVRSSPESPIVVRAPGRVNLIGEHTDYNGGYVLPVAIDLEIRICVVPTDDRRVALTRLDTGEQGAFDLDEVSGPQDSWIDYVAAVAIALQAAGVMTRGLRGVIASDLPISSGLSSSAALELAAAWALAVERPPLDPMDLARLAQRAENEYVGVRSGIMDQFAVAFGRADAALLLDCRSLEHRPVPLPLGDASLVVCDSHAPRDLADSAYNERRRECEAVVERLQAYGEAVETLRDVDEAMLDRHAAHLDAVGLARAGHVVSENRRVLATVEALIDGDLAGAGRLLAASHRSLRDAYEVSSPELDVLVGIADRTPGVFGGRMTGAGFGGCTVNLVAAEAVERFREAILTRYPARTGRTAEVHIVSPAPGAGLLEES